MANLATITTTSTAVPGLNIVQNGNVSTTILGSFSAEMRGKIFSIIGGGTKLSFDLTSLSDTVTIEGTAYSGASAVMDAFNAEFVK